MGRHAGWIACEVAMAVGADYVLLPEIPVNIDDMCKMLLKRREGGKQWGMVIVSEGAKLIGGTDVVTRNATLDAFGHEQLGGIGQLVAHLIQEKTGIETREVVLGHIQRGGSPTAFDRILGTRLGLGAGRLVQEKKFGRMVALAGTKIIDVAIADAVGQMKQVSPDWIQDVYEFSK
jgi:6-phosphofructokinase 1